MSLGFLKKLVPESWIRYLTESLPLSCGGILMFHHIAPVNREGIQYNEHLKVSPEFLDRTLNSFRQLGFTFISADELADLLKRRKRFSKVIALTFDDGYKDNLTAGLPVLEQYNAPGTIYVATGLMRNEVIPWWDILEEYLLSLPETVEFEGNIYPVRTLSEKGQAYLKIREKIMFDSDSEIRRRLHAAGIQPEIKAASPASGMMVSEGDFRKYADHRLISFGSHTHSHLACGKLDEVKFEEELRKSIQILQSAGIKVRHFAYPYGNDLKPRKDFADILRKYQIRTGMTTCAGVFCPDSDPWFLPRLFVSEYAEGLVWKDYFWLQRRPVIERLKQWIPSRQHSLDADGQ